MVAPVSKFDIVEKKIMPLMEQVHQLCINHGISHAASFFAGKYQGDKTCLEYSLMDKADDRADALPDHLIFMVGIVSGKAVPIPLGKADEISNIDSAVKNAIKNMSGKINKNEPSPEIDSLKSFLDGFKNNGGGKKEQGD